MSTANADLSIWRRNKHLHCLLCIDVITHSGGQGHITLCSICMSPAKGLWGQNGHYGQTPSLLWVRAGWVIPPPGVLFSTACQVPVQKRIDSSVPLGAWVWPLCRQRCPHHPPDLPSRQSLADDTTVTDLHTACVR